MKDRIYICHTYYHVYVTFLKELKLRAEADPAKKAGAATLVLSKMSNNFENLKSRVESTGLFEEVLEFDEKREDFFPELEKYREDTGSFLGNLKNRIRFTKEYARLEASYVPVDLRTYKDIYVYCDSDPIGYYLNQNHIRYLNLIFVQNGYGKYCMDMEVNDISAIRYPCPRYIELPRKPLEDRLTAEDKQLLLQAFVRNKDELEHQIEESNKVGDKILILTDPVCALDVREQIFRDIIKMYEKEGTIFLKPHPRDLLDYQKLFAEYPQFDASMPMEMLNFFPNLRFKKVVTIFTEVKGLPFADEAVRLGPDFMDAYEDPLIHRQNEQI